MTETELNRWLNDQKTPLLQALDDVFKMQFNAADGSAAEFEETVCNKLAALKSVFERDVYWNAVMVHDRIYKSVQDICIENSAGHNSKCVCLELSSTEQIKLCLEAVSSHPLLELDWYVAGPQVRVDWHF